MTRSSAGFAAGASGSARGAMLNDARGHLGRRHKSARRHIEQDARIGDPLHQHREPSIGLAARRRDQALGDFALKHQGQALIFRDPLEPADKECGGDVVGQVRDDLAGRPARAPPGRVRARRRRRARAAPDKRRQARRAPPDNGGRARSQRPGARRRRATPASDRRDRDRSRRRRMVERPRRSGDPARQVEVEEEILAEALVRDDTVSGDDLAQRRQRGRGRVGRPGYVRRSQTAAARLAAISAASRSAAIRLSGRATPRPAIAKAVP